MEPLHGRLSAHRYPTLIRDRISREEWTVSKDQQDTSAADDQPSPSTAAEFDREFATVDRSSGLRRVWQRASPDLPPEIEPYSFVSVALLDHVADALALAPGTTLVDLGCGRGGPGLWLAQSHGAMLIGVDFSAAAVQQATDRAALFGLADRARFVMGDLAATGLADGAADAVVSIDALHFAVDPTAAAREALRLLRPGGRLALTNWQPRNPSRAACGSTGPTRWARRGLPRCGWSPGRRGTTCSPGCSRSRWSSGIQAMTSDWPRCRTRHARHSQRRTLSTG
jgi:SAM-dependent methyltransferase